MLDLPVAARAGGATSLRRPAKQTLAAEGDLPPPPGRGVMVLGSTVFHSRQVSRQPAHLGVTALRDWQTKRVVGLAKETPGRGRRRGDIRHRMCTGSADTIPVRAVPGAAEDDAALDCLN